MSPSQWQGKGDHGKGRGLRESTRTEGATKEGEGGWLSKSTRTEAGGAFGGGRHAAAAAVHCRAGCFPEAKIDAAAAVEREGANCVWENVAVATSAQQWDDWRSIRQRRRCRARRAARPQCPAKRGCAMPLQTLPKPRLWLKAGR
eukprot:245694-Chlamydomonas_euryale.AAC.1